MEWLRETAILSGSCLWREGDGEPWLVGFDFAVVNDRLECVGMRLRSYVGAVGQDELGDYVAYFVGEITSADLLSGSGPAPAMRDADAWGAILEDPQGWAPRHSPRPLRTTTLRELPLVTIAAQVRQKVAVAWRSGLVAPRTAAHLVESELAAAPAAVSGAPFREVSSEREGARAAHLGDAPGGTQGRLERRPDQTA